MARVPDYALTAKPNSALGSDLATGSPWVATLGAAMEASQQQDRQEQGSDLRRIHAGARGVILDWYGESDVPPSKIWRELLAREGISMGVDVYQEIFRRYGEDEFKITIDAWREREKSLETLLVADSMPEFLKGEALLPHIEREIRSLLLSVPDGCEPWC